ncbi:MAG: TldD/PmbA family protein [Candidatus Hodarchaeota archaeon]
MEDLAQNAIEAALKTGASFVDVRIENTKGIEFEIVNGATKRSLASELKGAGIRAFINGAWAFAHTSNLTPRGMRETGASVARMALAICRNVKNRFEIDGPTFKDKVKLSVKQPLQDVPAEEKISFVKMIDKQARDFDERIKNTNTLYTEVWTELFVANSLGTNIWMETSLPRIRSISIAKDEANRQTASKSAGMRGGFETMEDVASQSVGEESAKLAIELLSSIMPKGGIYDIIVDPALNGCLVHEAFGHPCEADNWIANTTVLEGKLGTKVGFEQLNLSDDPTIPGWRGSFEYDWEGTKTQKRLLVKKGVLTELLHSLETSVRLGLEPNGASRSQSFMYEPIPRMSNTFMEPSDWSFEELLSDMKNGLLLCGIGGGYTKSAIGQFMFKAAYGYMIVNGEKGQIIRGASVAGQILDFLTKIDAIGKDFGKTAENCGKGSQIVPDMSGGPHTRIRKAPVGGK